MLIAFLLIIMGWLDYMTSTKLLLNVLTQYELMSIDFSIFMDSNRPIPFLVWVKILDFDNNET